MIDKAKAYDEALERAQKQRDDYQKELDNTDKNSQLANILRAGISAIEMIFPQLKESDDERIRKDIIDHFESIKSRAFYDNQEESDNIISSCNEKIAYLEKQKEKKSIEWNQKDEKIIKTIIDVLERNGQITVYEQRGGTMSGSVGYSNKYEEEIAWLKDISLNHKKFIEAVDKLWSNELSGEDEKDVAHIIRILDDCYAYGRHDLSKTDHENLVNKLKSLHPIKQDWTEEDEAHRDFILESLEDQIRFCKKDAEGAHYAKQIRTAQNWLKSFKPHWKPTKEHIDAIEECLEFYAESTDTYRHLKSLLSELVKL